MRPTRLLDQVREHIRYLHYSFQTENAYLHEVRFFTRWRGRDGIVRHPRDMGAVEVEAFLTMLATERRVSASPQLSVGPRSGVERRRHFESAGCMVAPHLMPAPAQTARPPQAG